MNGETDPADGPHAHTEASAECCDETRTGGLLARMREHIRQQPFGAVGGAFAIGVIVGTRLPARVGHAGVMIGIPMLIKRALSKGRDSDPTRS